jgi:tetratricopeptide (TPR) repeat protein
MSKLANQYKGTVGRLSLEDLWCARGCSNISERTGSHQDWRNVGQSAVWLSSLNEMARAQASLSNNKDALLNFEEALQIRREIGDKRGLSDTLIDIGNFSNERGDYDLTLKTYKQALYLERDLSNEGMQAICLIRRKASTRMR